MMEYQLQLKPPEKQNGAKYKIIKITDIALHLADKQPIKYISKKIKNSIEQNKLGKI